MYHANQRYYVLLQRIMLSYLPTHINKRTLIVVLISYHTGPWVMCEGMGAATTELLSHYKRYDTRDCTSALSTEDYTVGEYLSNTQCSHRSYPQ